MMEYRTLGRTGLRVALLGMGTGGHNCLGQCEDLIVPHKSRLIACTDIISINVCSVDFFYTCGE